MNPIRQFKEATGLSYMLIGQLLGVGVSNVANWHTGRYRAPADIQATLERLVNKPEISPWIDEPDRSVILKAITQGQTQSNGVTYLPSGRRRYPLHRLAVGESFFVKSEINSVAEIDRLGSAVNGSMQAVQRKTGKKFKLKRVFGGVEVRRTK